MSLQAEFEKLTGEERLAFVTAKQQEAIRGDVDEYIVLPIVAPRPSIIAGQGPTFELGFIVGTPGPVPNPQKPDKMTRVAIPMPMPNEDVCADFVAAMNMARRARLAGEKIMDNWVKRKMDE